MDRSEINEIRFCLESLDRRKLKHRLDHLQSGQTTHGIWAGNRVFVDVSAQDAYTNLNTRKTRSGKLSRYDPQTLADIRNRIVYEHKARQLVTQLKSDKRINIIHFTNKRMHDQAALPMHLRRSAELIQRQLILELAIRAAPA